ncbi:hypothetical protein REPUB_Repub08aG0003500 [Reevesia pubescens]
MVDLVGGYYDAGDNVKFNFPMAFSITMLAWSVLEFGQSIGSDLQHALDAIQWGTDYFFKATSIPGFVFAQVGDPYGDHNCWERPEDMDTPRTSFAVSKQFPGSEVSAEIAVALAASSMVFRPINRAYSARLLKRARMDELLWGAACLLKATKATYYWKYVLANIRNLEKGSSLAKFGWDTKHAGINVPVSRASLLLFLLLIKSETPFPEPFVTNADKFVCSVLAESPTVSVSYSPGGLLIKPGGNNLQHATALSFLLLVYSRHLSKANELIHCDNINVKSQVDYILGSNPLNMSYMVGHGNKFPKRIHRRGSSLPSITQNPHNIDCGGGDGYFSTQNPNPNLLTGAAVGGPDITDSYADSYAPLVGLLAYFKSH